MNQFWKVALYSLLGLIVLGAIMRWILVTYLVKKSVEIEQAQTPAIAPAK